MTAKAARTRTEVKESVSLEEANWCRVVPAWMATKDGGATPDGRQRHGLSMICIFISKHEEGRLTNECAQEERSNRHVDDRRSDVNEPVWKERSDS